MKKLITIVLALMMMFPLSACGGSSNTSQIPDSTAPPHGYDVEYTIVIDGSDSWMPFSDERSVAFANSDEKIISITDDGKRVRFIGVDIGEAEVTATSGNKAAKALVKVIKRSENIGTSKHYISYNKPVNAYYIELNGGNTKANENVEKGDRTLVMAYENKESLEIGGYYDDVNNREVKGLMSVYNSPSASYIRYSETPGENCWIADDNGVDEYWEAENYKTCLYPLGEFAAFVTGHVNTSLAELAVESPDKLPNQLDVTGYYVRVEKVMDILCDVYEYDLVTWWVDPKTGFTLKMEVEGGGAAQNWEVTKLVIGSPDWDGLHLRPQNGDTELSPSGERTFD